MEDQYPYTGYGDYNTTPGLFPPQTSEPEKMTAAETEEAASLVIAGAVVPGRLFEISLVDEDSREKNDYATAAHGYKYASIAHVRDPKRVSVHPLGLCTFPGGVEKKYWKSLDTDRVLTFEEPKTVPPAPLPEPAAASDTGEKAVTLPERIRRFASGGGSDGGKTGVPEHEEERDPSEMPFLDHLEEFRWVILKSIITIMITMIASWYLADWFYSQITVLAANAGMGKLVFTKVLEPIMLRLQMAFFMGLFIAIPFIFYFIWSFVSPGLYKNEKRWVLPLIFSATGCFFIGAALAWFVMVPYMLKFINLNFALPGLQAMVTIGPFVGLIIKFVIAFGITFELPVVTFVLAKIGIVKHTFMSKYRGYAIVIIFIISAVVTPTVDPISQTLFAIPLYILYEISILVARIAGRKTLL
ncbi:MAG: twin-arginine translocase subunit TatC [Candidatus Latescibacter sp.]|nr:twin-arginine translocase subunit TatC [Candidatus Latescibacter sp.]